MPLYARAARSRRENLPCRYRDGISRCLGDELVIRGCVCSVLSTSPHKLPTRDDWSRKPPERGPPRPVAHQPFITSGGEENNLSLQQHTEAHRKTHNAPFSCSLQPPQLPHPPPTSPCPGIFPHPNFPLRPLAGGVIFACKDRGGLEFPAPPRGRVP